MVIMAPWLYSRVVGGGDPVVGEGLLHVLRHPAPRLSAHQVLEVEVKAGKGATWVSLKIMKCMKPSEPKLVLSSEGSKFLHKQ